MTLKIQSLLLPIFYFSTISKVNFISLDRNFLFTLIRNQYFKIIHDDYIQLPIGSEVSYRRDEVQIISDFLFRRKKY